MGSGWPEITSLRGEGTEAESKDLSELPSQEALRKLGDRATATASSLQAGNTKGHSEVRARPAVFCLLQVRMHVSYRRQDLERPGKWPSQGLGEGLKVSIIKQDHIPQRIAVSKTHQGFSDCPP